MFKKLAATALFVTVVWSGMSAQDAPATLATVSRAMGADAVTSITYSGTAANGNFGQSTTIAGPLAMTAITAYTRAIDFTQPFSRATGPTVPPTVAGAPPPPPGTFNQGIGPTAAWPNLVDIWITPWGFVKGATANSATVRPQRIGAKSYSVVSWTPLKKSPSGQDYKIVGYINEQHLIDRVETWVEHPVLGDMHVEATYGDYKDFGGLKVPTRIVQKRAGMQTFEATITDASANPANIAELLQGPPAPAGRGAAPGAAPVGPPAPPAMQSEKMGEGVYRITGGYVALAVEFKDHVVVLEGGQHEARGLAVIGEVKRLFPTKPIRYVVNTHAHFDHSGGLAPFAAEGITIVTHNNNRAFLEKALSAPRTLLGDALAKGNRKPKIEGAGTKRVLTDGTQTIELHHIPNLAHSDGMLVALLPKEKILFTGDFNIPAAGQPAAPAIATLVQHVERLKLDFERHVLVHAPNPDRPLTKADLLALLK